MYYHYCISLHKILPIFLFHSLSPVFILSLTCFIMLVFFFPEKALVTSCSVFVSFLLAASSALVKSCSICLHLYHLLLRFTSLSFSLYFFSNLSFFWLFSYQSVICLIFLLFFFSISLASSNFCV